MIIPPPRLLVFPLAARIALVRRLAQQILARHPEEGEKHLALQLRRQDAVLRRKGLVDDVVRRELEAFTAAVRREIWRIVLRVPSPPPPGQRDTGA